MKKHHPPAPFSTSDPSSSGFHTTILRVNETIEPKRKHTNSVSPNTSRRKNKNEVVKAKDKPPPLLLPSAPDQLLPAPVVDSQQVSKSSLLRLFVKKGEYVYARPTDIVLIESCDHLVKVYIACDQKLIRAVRNSTLKDFLLLLPEQQFLRLGRFCAVNLQRLSGSNYQQQIFEFDFRVSVKLKHTLPFAAFKSIGT
jgi:hypothetical protein